MNCGGLGGSLKASLPVGHSENSIDIIQIVVLYFASF